MFREWRDRGLFESIEQRVYDQPKIIRKKWWLSKLELETIKIKVEDEFQGQFDKDAATKVDVVEKMKIRQRMKI